MKITLTCGTETSTRTIKAKDLASGWNVVELAVKAAGNEAALNFKPSGTKGGFFIHGLEVRRVRFKQSNILPAIVEANDKAIDLRVLDPSGVLFGRPSFYASKTVEPADLVNGRVADVEKSITGRSRCGFSDIYINLGEARKLSGIAVYGRATSYFIQVLKDDGKTWETVAKVKGNRHPVRVFGFKPVTTAKLRIGLPLNGHISEIELFSAP
ncbi:MAG: discoidin domain-containing protein [Planctomycetia bacterium]|nr:discoidin domain-containing protein [Planctomycetia bacterium]